MKKRMFFIMTVLTLGKALLFAGNPDFSGTWILDREKSETGEGGRMRMTALKLTVTQAENQLTIERFVSSEFRGDFTTTEQTMLDGRETVNPSEFGDRRLSAAWSKDGKILTIGSTMEMDRGGETFQIRVTESWILEEGGAVLKIDQTRITPRGERKGILYYKKEKTRK
ncbi:MAG TPA: hypothetical protein ENN17_10150 [bacterium]|nr:hypothetical protein [bacterium]